MSATNETAIARCGCGEWMGEGCDWTGPVSEMVVVEYMPECHRASHEAARNSGSWPHNGSVRVACCRGCAEDAVESDPEWVAIIDRDPAKYADTDDEE